MQTLTLILTNLLKEKIELFKLNRTISSERILKVKLISTDLKKVNFPKALYLKPEES